MTGRAALNQNFPFMFKNISYIFFGSQHTNCNLVEKKCNMLTRNFEMKMSHVLLLPET